MRILPVNNNYYTPQERYYTQPSFQAQIMKPASSQGSSSFISRILGFFKKNKDSENIVENKEIKIVEEKAFDKLEEFFSGTIDYSGKQYQKFEALLNKYDFNPEKSEEANQFLNKILCRFENSEDISLCNYLLDYILRFAKTEQIEHLGGDVFRLADVKFKEEDKEKARAYLLSDFHTAPIGSRWSDFYKRAIDNENVNLLKLLIEDLNWRVLVNDYNRNNASAFIESIEPIINAGWKSNNPEVREVFNDDNVYNIIKNIPVSGLVIFEKTDFLNIMLEKAPNPQKVLDQITEAGWGILFKTKEQIQEYLGNFPTSAYERYKSSTDKENRDTIRNANIMREIKLSKDHNGLKTPQDILNALNDRRCTGELLNFSGFDNSSIMDFIARIPYSEKDKETISKIAERLYKIYEPKDDDRSQKHALLAAMNGNNALLKFFEDKHVHYRHLITSPIESYPKQVRETIQNSKLNDRWGILKFNDAARLKTHLEEHPEIDVNSRDYDGIGLILRAFKAENLDILKYLATRDDVDWNIRDNNGENILMHLISDKKDAPDIEFKKEVIKLLRELPEGKFDVNYVNYNNGAVGRRYPYSALSSFLNGKTYNLDENMFDELLKFPELDTNNMVYENVPLLVYLINGLSSDFKKIYNHPNTNREVILNNPDLEIPWRIQDFLEEEADKNVIKNIKEIYDKNGELTLEQIQQFIQYKNIDKIIDAKLNIVGENILHFLADINITSDNINQVEALVKLIAQNHLHYLNIPDDFGTTPIDKIINAENTKIADLIKKKYLAR